MRIIVSILMIIQLALIVAPRIYGEDTDTPNDNVTDNSTDDNITDDNITDDNITDDNVTEDNETVKKLKALFATVYDNYSCINPFDPVLFPYGTRLENCVRHDTGVIRWPMLCSQAAQITSITCNDTEITSLDGLQQFPNLKNLTFSARGTKIDSLAPIRNLTKLETLEIPYSNISEIGFLANMKRLRHLNLKANSVTNLEFIFFLSGLETLSLEFQAPNYITDITQLGSLTRLYTLSLQGNKITDIAPLANLHNLTFLSIRDNRISNLTPLDNLTNLQMLNFSINMVSSIEPLTNLKQLTTLIGNSNKITSLKPIDNNTAIRELQFMTNSISDLEAVKKMRYLKKINMDFNSIKDISPLSTLTIHANLLELSLTYNCIPEDSFQKILYIDYISKLRLGHQCEEFPDDIYSSDNQTIVNSDLVNSKDTLLEDNITLTEFESTAGRGCSAVPYNTTPIYDVLLIILASFLAVKLYRTRRK